MEQIGVMKATVGKALGLCQTEDIPIYIGSTNLAHIQNKHPDDYKKYGAYISDIINFPDYAAINQKDQSIELVKTFLIHNEYVKVAVRVSDNGRYFARSLYVLNDKRVKNFIHKGTLKPIKNNGKLV